MDWFSFERIDSSVTSFDFLRSLTNLTGLSMSEIDPSVTSFDFLNSLTNLTHLDMYGNGNRIDVKYLENMRKLKTLELKNFTILNFHLLDNLPELNGVCTWYSNFDPEDNNKLKHVEVQYVYYDH